MHGTLWNALREAGVWAKPEVLQEKALAVASSTYPLISSRPTRPPKTVTCQNSNLIGVATRQRQRLQKEHFGAAVEVATWVNVPANASELPTREVWGYMREKMR